MFEIRRPWRGRSGRGPEGRLLALALGGLLIGTPALATTISAELEDFTGGDAIVDVTLSDDAAGLADGDILVTVEVLEGDEGSIRGIFFHLVDDSLLDSIEVTGDDVEA
jgi:hypothetical protein